MTAVDNLVSDLKASKISAFAQPLVASIDDFIAALQQLQGGSSGPAGGDLGGSYPNPTVTGLQGVPVSNAAPGANNVLTFTGGQWTPQAPAASGPALVQNAAVTVAAHSTGILLSSGPVQGNILIAIASDQSTFPAVGAGWSLYGSLSAAQDGFGVAFKIAGAAESTTQVPFSDAHPGTISVWEFSNGTPGIWSNLLGFTSAAPATNAANSKSSGGIIVGICCIRVAGVNPTSITGAVQQQTASGNGRSVVNFMASAPAVPTQTITVNYAAAQSGMFATYSLG